MINTHALLCCETQASKPIFTILGQSLGAPFSFCCRRLAGDAQHPWRTVSVLSLVAYVIQPRDPEPGAKSSKAQTLSYDRNLEREDGLYFEEAYISPKITVLADHP